jgi:hypothetical protein
MYGAIISDNLAESPIYSEYEFQILSVNFFNFVSSVLNLLVNTSGRKSLPVSGSYSIVTGIYFEIS